MWLLIKSFIAGIADRFRGTGGKFTLNNKPYDVARLVTLLLVGYSVSIILGVYWGIDALKISFLVGLGFSFGWGQPLGAALAGVTPLDHKLRRPGDTWEWWQFGILKLNAYYALGFRGALVGLPLLLVYPLYGLTIMLSYAISFPLAVKSVLLLDLNDGWSGQEYGRSIISGIIAGSIIGVLSWLYS